MLLTNEKTKLLSLEKKVISYDQSNQFNTSIPVDLKPQENHILEKQEKTIRVLRFGPLIYVLLNSITLFTLSDQRSFTYFGCFIGFLFSFFVLRGIISKKQKHLINFCIDFISSLFFGSLLIYFLKNTFYNKGDKIFPIYTFFCFIIFLSIHILKVSWLMKLKHQSAVDFISILITFITFCAMFYFYDCYLCNILYFFSILIDLFLIYQERKYDKLCMFFYDEAFIFFIFLLNFYLLSFNELVSPTWLDLLAIERYNSIHK